MLYRVDTWLATHFSYNITQREEPLQVGRRPRAGGKEGGVKMCQGQVP